MAQTVAIQRGTTSLTTGASPTTIYTQSGGLATRVIWNFVVFYSAGTYGSGYFTIAHTSSAGGTAPMGYWRVDTAWGNGALMPNQGATGPSQWVGATTTLAPAYGSMGSGTTNSYAAANTGSNLNFVQPNTSGRGAYLPQNYWIGPSDVIKFAWVDTNSNDITQVAWSFVTITES